MQIIFFTALFIKQIPSIRHDFLYVFLKRSFILLVNFSYKLLSALCHVKYKIYQRLNED